MLGARHFASAAMIAIAFCPGTGFAVERAILGVNLANLTQTLCDQWNAGDLSDIEHGLIVYTEEDTPAARAGIRTGDVLVQLNDQPIYLTQDVTRITRDASPGDPFTAWIHREQQEIMVAGVFGASDIPLRERVAPTIDAQALRALELAAKQSPYFENKPNGGWSSGFARSEDCEVQRYEFQPNTYPPDAPPPAGLIVETLCKRATYENEWHCDVEEKIRRSREDWEPMPTSCD